MNSVPQYTRKFEYVRKFDPVNNAHIANAFDGIWDKLDFGPRNAELEKLGRDLYLKLEAEINAVLNDHTDAALWLGWQAAKNPAAWLFDDDGELMWESPANLLTERMAAMGLGNEDIFGRDDALARVIIPLFCEAETLAFAMGMELQRDPERLIFPRPGDDD